MTIVILFEIVLDNHKSRCILFFEILYSFSLIGMNVLLLCKHQFFGADDEIQIDLEIYMKLLIYLMFILLALIFVAKIRDSIECKCSSATVVPAGTIPNSNKTKKGAKKKKEGDGGKQ